MPRGFGRAHHGFPVQQKRPVLIGAEGTGPNPVLFLQDMGDLHGCRYRVADAGRREKIRFLPHIDGSRTRKKVAQYGGDKTDQEHPVSDPSLEKGVPGVHFYTLNRARALLNIFNALGII